MKINRVVLDTNCLIAILSRKGNYFPVWQGLHQGKYTLCVSNDILEEYEEILSQKTNATIASNVIQVIVNSPYVEFIDTYQAFKKHCFSDCKRNPFSRIYESTHVVD